MTRILTVLLLAAGVAACIEPRVKPLETPAERVEITPRMRTLIETGARKGLKDPESARYGEMWAARTTAGPIYVCGFLNAKNSFGGYTGMEPFSGVLQDDEFSLVGSGSRSLATGQAVIAICRDRYGLPIP